MIITPANNQLNTKGEAGPWIVCLRDGRNANVNSSILVFVQKLFVPSNCKSELTLLPVSSLKPSPVLATKVLVRDGKDQHYFLKKKDMSSHLTNDNWTLLLRSTSEEGVDIFSIASSNFLLRAVWHSVPPFRNSLEGPSFYSVTLPYQNPKK